MRSAVAAIPSPSFNSVGPFQIYGMLIAIGVVAAIVLSQRRWVARGGREDDISTIAMWSVPAGVIGARAYHVLTDFQRFSDEPWWKVFAIREGGLGIPGGMLVGVLVGVWVAKRLSMDVLSGLDAVVPALPLAQAIGRWGNYFNQELFGRPTTMPWGLEIDADHRGAIPLEYRDVDAFPTFHPTFLYESMWNVGLVAVILWVDRKKALPKGRLIGVYLLGYGLGRAVVESIRIDIVNTIFGLRLNIWMSLVLILSGLAVLLWPNRNARRLDLAPGTLDSDAGRGTDVDTDAEDGSEVASDTVNP